MNLRAFQTNNSVVANGDMENYRKYSMTKEYDKGKRNETKRMTSGQIKRTFCFLLECIVF
jgi:hypothetical protein